MGPTLLDISQGELFQRFGVALCIGLFIGLEREYSTSSENKTRAAGLRTHAVIALLGASAGLVGALGMPAAPPILLLAVASFVVASYVLCWLQSGRGLGITSETVVLLTFVLGLMAIYGRVREAVVLAGAVSVILSAKAPMHRFVGALSTLDWAATMKFAVITLVVLPLLPNFNYGLFGAFNPFKIWLMVVLIGGISFLGYALAKYLGTQRSIALTSLIGGLASSTAVTLSNARRARQEADRCEHYAVGTILAHLVELPRVALIIAAINPALLGECWAPLLLMAAAAGLYGGVLYLRECREEAGAHPGTEHANPFELGPALKFAAAFAVVTFVVKAVQAELGRSAIYYVSVVASLPGIDAITAALAQQARPGAAEVLPLRVAGAALVLAVVANSFVKGSAATWIGGWRHGRHVLAALLVAAVVSLVALRLMP